MHTPLGLATHTRAHSLHVPPDTHQVPATTTRIALNTGDATARWERRCAEHGRRKSALLRRTRRQQPGFTGGVDLLFIKEKSRSLSTLTCCQTDRRPLLAVARVSFSWFFFFFFPFSSISSSSKKDTPRGFFLFFSRSRRHAKQQATFLATAAQFLSLNPSGQLGFRSFSPPAVRTAGLAFSRVGFVNIEGRNTTFRSETRLETALALSRTETPQTAHPKRLSLPWRCFARNHRKRAWWCGRRACVVVVRWWQCGGGGAAGDWATGMHMARARVCAVVQCSVGGW